MWILIHTHIGLSAVYIVDGIATKAWPSVTFLLDWSLLRIQEFCKMKEWRIDDEVIQIKKSKPRNRKYQSGREKKIA